MTAACLFFLPTGAAAAPLPEENGLLVQLAQGEELAQLPIGVSEICGERGLYLAENSTAVRSISRRAEIVYTEENAIVELYGAVNDPHYLDGSQWELSTLCIDTAWERGLTGAGVRIGLVDSGVNPGHQDLAGAHILAGYDYLEQDTMPRDTVGHGTFITGILAAQVNNGLGTVGLAPEVEIVPLRCFAGANGTLGLVVKAIYDAIDTYHCQIINLSLGVTTDYDSLRDAVLYAESKGVVVVAAVGNSGHSGTVTDPVSYPAGYATVIGVGAIGKNQTLSSFSQKNRSVFLVAPGEEMLGLSHTDPAGYRQGSGTSYAAPLVTATVALLMQAQPGLMPQGIRDELQASAMDLGEPGRDDSYGFGLVPLNALRSPPLLQAEESPDGLSITLSNRSLPPQTSLTVCVAAYDVSGRLCALTTREAVTEKGVLVLSGLFLPTTDVVTLKAFFPDSADAPLDAVLLCTL
ncbi:MAG: S8 family serine peptidase [Oscillospiraceae bacterium]